jgi:hypothetical protein
MAYVPGFDQDIFISYAQVDNEPLDIKGREICWVSHLKEQLQRRIDQKLGRKGASKIWMDLDDLAGNESVTPAIDSAINKTAALVVVLSDGYLSSVWCRKEIRSFVETANANGRLFVVHLAEIPLDAQPEEIRDLIGFNFFDKELKAELDPSSGEYSKALLKLREKLSGKLSELKQTPDLAEDRGNAASSSPAVLLAESTPDRDDERGALATYIEKLGYRVLPAKLYPRGAQEFQTMLDQDLAKAKLFIQLLGPFCTRRTEDFPEGYEGLELGRAKIANVPILRAYERDTVDFEKIKNEAHRSILEASDVMALDIEEFKVAIKEKLNELTLRESKPVAVSMDEYKPVLIHVLDEDQKSARQVCTHLDGLNVLWEIVEEDESLEELAKIQDFAGMVLVYGEKSSGKWIKQQMRTFMNVRLSKQPIEPGCVMYFDPPEMRQQLLASPPPFFRTIDSSNGEPDFQQFIDELRASVSTS